MAAPTSTEASPAADSIDPELAVLEQRLASLVAYANGLRTANDALRRALSTAEAQNQDLSRRVAEASRRLDALLARLPEAAE